jgi:arylsulfatase A-like enzyme
VGPLEVPPGYTEWYGSIDPLAYEYYGYVLNENGTLVTYGSIPDQYQADVYTAKAVVFIGRRGRAAATVGKPFFLFVTYLAPQTQHGRPGKVLPYEPAVKVPLLIRGPGVTPRRNVGAPVANIDLARTIVATAGASARHTMDGRSLWPLLQWQVTWATPRRVLVEDSPLGAAASVFWSIRKAKFVYTEYANGDREFYDLAKDSAQVASRHADPAYAEIRLRLTKRLAAMKTCRGPAACW